MKKRMKTGHPDPGDKKFDYLRRYVRNYVEQQKMNRISYKKTVLGRRKHFCIFLLKQSSMTYIRIPFTLMFF